MPDGGALDQALELSARIAGGPFAWVLFVTLEKKVQWAPQPEIPWRKVLLFRHSMDPRLWGLPGGPIADGETAEAAARRWAEAQTTHDRGEEWATVLDRSVFSDPLDYAGGQIFVAQVDMEPLELLRATNSETFWCHSDFARETPRAIHHPAALAAFDHIDNVNLQPLKLEENTMSSRAEYVAAQARATEILHELGDAAGAPPFLQGETLLGYRARLASQFQRYSRQCQKIDLTRVGDPHAFAALEDQIYLDAGREAEHPTIFKAGELRAIRKADASGRVITRYVGDINGFMDQFNPPIQYVRRLLAPGVPRV